MALAALLSVPLWGAAASRDAEAKYAAFVMDADSGRVLHATNADTRNHPASLTKMMTLYLVFEALEDGRLSLGQRLTVSRQATRMPPSKLGLRRGQTIRVEDAILSLVTKSANDVAVVLAESLAKTESHFAQQMTRKAKTLGMSRTSFRNASGLYNGGQLSTARDMATLALALMRDYPKQYRYFATPSFTYQGRKYRNHNKLLKSYKGTDGVKTGYIAAAGYNLAASAKRDGRRVIAVVFGGRSGASRNRHVAKLLDRGFRKLRDPIYLASGGKVEGILPPPTRKPLAVAKAEIQPAKATPKTTTRSVAKLAPENRWGIQVGAFYRHAPAKKAAETALSKLPDDLSDTRVAITHITGQRGRIYRARLVGLTEPRARQACRKLEALKTDCLVIQHRGAVELAQNQN